jgi:hypothetical protein
MDSKDFFKLGGFSVIVVALAGLTAFAGVILELENGDFSDGLNGWTAGGNVTDGGGYALFEVEGGSDQSSLSQKFILPTLALELSFEVEMSGDSTEDGMILSDMFAASLLNPDTLEPLIYNPGHDEFYRWENIGTGYVVTVATVSGSTVSLDVSGLAGQDVLLSFDLRGSDDGKLTSVGVDNVSVSSVIPAPGALMLGLIGTGLVGFLRRSRIGKIS